jgi:hypothetical protein
MERRRNIRYLVSKYIGIMYPGGKTVTGRTRDAGSEGVFVELDIVDPPAHAMVQLLIPVSTRPTLVDHLRIPAVITRRAKDGIGLRYTCREDIVLDYVRP